jgi:hypothetical protein
MNISIHATFLAHNNPDASLAFYRDALGFEVRNDVGYDGMRWITVGPSDQPDMSIVLAPPGADPAVTDDERRTILEMMAKGSYGHVILATERSRGCKRMAPRWPTSQPSSHTGSATAPSAIRQATSCVSTNCTELLAIRRRFI